MNVAAYARVSTQRQAEEGEWLLSHLRRGSAHTSRNVV